MTHSINVDSAPKVPSIASVAFRAVGWILVVWLCVFGASWFVDAGRGNWKGYVLLVLAVLLMYIGPAFFRSLGGAACGVLFMILGSTIIVAAHPLQTAALASRGEFVTATVGRAVVSQAHLPGPWACVPGTDGRILNQIDIPASAGVGHGCLDVSGTPDPCHRTSCPEALKPGERLSVLVDPRHDFASAAKYRSTGRMETVDYLSIVFLLGYPVLIFAFAARALRRRKRDQLAKWNAPGGADS